MAIRTRKIHEIEKVRETVCVVVPYIVSQFYSFFFKLPKNNQNTSTD